MIRDVAEVTIIDAYKYDMSEHEFIKKIKELKPDIVGITVLFDQYGDSGHRVAQLVKKINKNIKTVIGGVYATTNNDKVAKDKNIDAVVSGEGEYILRYLVLTYLLGRWDYRFGLDALKITNLDVMPKPSYDLIKYLDYANSASRKSVDSPRGFPYARIMTSRGCPIGCSFCQVETIAGKDFRARSADNVLDEIQWLKETYGIKSLIFDDDNLLYDKKRASEIFYGMIDRKLNMPWVSIGLAVFKLDRELLRLMRLSGCEYIAVAIESGTQRVLKQIINKPISFDYAKEMVKCAREQGIYVAANFIVGFPTETWDEIRSTLRFAEELNTDYSKIFHAVPLPHTRLWNLCEKENVLPDKKNEFVWSKGNINTKEFSSNDLTVLRAYEWDRINFTDPIKRERTRLMMNITEDELDKIRKDTLKNACSLIGAK
jgi:radical SAM superfamily enzyme YgiQ (UPF0313 family)